MAGIWSLLPLDIIGDIALKLETFEDFIRFSAVCRSWNQASSLIKHQWSAKSPLPWLLLPENSHENPNCVRKCFNITNNKCYQLNLPQTFGIRCWGSACGWVAMVDRDHNVELFNPITKAQISFPSLEATYKLHRKHEEEIVLEKDYFEWFMHEFLKKLIVIKVSQGDHYEFVIMILYNEYERLAFARHGDQTWTSIIVGKNGEIVDAVVRADQVFALYEDGSLVYWNVNKFCGCDIVVPIDYCPPADLDPRIKLYEKSMYLVQFDSDLFMVIRIKEQFGGDVGSDFELTYLSDEDGFDMSSVTDWSYNTKGFMVFKLDHISKSWEEIEDLDNLILFVGDNYSTGVSLALDKCLKRNCIYFTDDAAEFWILKSNCGGLDMGIYDNKSGQKWQLYDGDMCTSLYPSIWFIPHF